MTASAAAWGTLAVYFAALLFVGLAVRRRSGRSAEGYFLGGRSLGPVVAALSASASSSSAWSLLGVSGAAASMGPAALWILPGCIGGFVLNWFVVAPRLQRAAHRGGLVTLTDLLASDGAGGRNVPVARLCSLLVLGSLSVYVAAQFQGAATAFARGIGMDRQNAMLLGVGVVLAYTLPGGFLAASVTDAIQAGVMALSAVVVPWAAVRAAGGLFAVLDAPGAGGPDAAGLHVALALLGIGLGYPGQPHVVNRFMATRDEKAVRLARWISLAWAVVLYSGMLLLGLAARAVGAGGEGEGVLLAAASAHLPPVLAAVVTAAVLSAVMSTVDSQLLVAAAAASHDLHPTRGRAGARRGRWAVAAVCALGAVLALGVDATIFARVLSAWDTLGAAFGPVLLWILWRGHPGPGVAAAAIVAGGGVSVGLSALALGDPAVRRIAPYLSAAVVLVLGGRRFGRGRDG